MDIDENKEAKGKKDTHGKKEGENEKSVIEKEAEIVDDGVETKEGELEDGGEKKNEGEVKENGDEKEGKEMEVVEEKEDTQQIKNVGNMEEVKEDTENANATKAEDVKMVDAEDVKDEEKGEIGEQEEKAQNREEKDVNKEGDAGTTEEKVDEDKEAEGSEKKRSRAKKASLKGKRKDKKEGETKAKQLLGSPVLSIERPVRERKIVERLVEIIERQPSKEFQVEKGQGTPLKDIPNVAYKLARRKPADIKLIHQTLFGRKGKAVDFKSHILQFSGFVWHGSDEKKRAKMKEKLDKYVEDALLDLCDFFDLPVSRANTRKEDLVAKLLDFLVAPHPTTDVALADKDQKSRRRKRMARGIASKMRGILTKCPRKKRTKSVDMPTAKEKSAQETEDAEEEDDDMENGLSEEKVHKHSEGEAKETESGEATDDDVDEEHEGQLGKGKQDKKKTIKQQGDVAKEKLEVGTSPKKSSLPKTTNSPGKRSAAKLSKAEEDNDISNKVFTGKKRNSDSSKKKSTLESSTKEKTTDKKMARGKAKPLEVEQPSTEDLRKKICEILKEVDFKATVIDILKELATHYKMDLTPRKASLKLMIQEELTKLAEEDEEDGEDVNYDEKEEKLETKGKEVEA